MDLLPGLIIPFLYSAYALTDACTPAGVVERTYGLFKALEELVACGPQGWGTGLLGWELGVWKELLDVLLHFPG